MEDGDGYSYSEDSLGSNCDTPTKQEFQSLKTKYEDPSSPEESTLEDDHHKVSNCYNNIAKSVCAKESHDLKVKVNGNIGSAIDTSKCGKLVIPNESSKSKTKGDRTCSDIDVVDKVNDEQAKLGEVVRKRKTCGSPDSSSAQHDSLESEVMQNTSVKKRKFSRVSIPTQSVIPQAEAYPSKPISEDSTSLQKSPSTLIESQSCVVSDPVEPDTHLTGFAQYLGLQPIVKFRCFKCEETGFPSLLKLQEHQNACLKNLKVPLLPKPSQPHVSVDPSLSSTNFRISRKVFLCGSCGTYYENWNLFLHMREVHKRLICLYCLTMFSQIDMLSAHLTAKHGIVETVHSSPEELLSDCKGSCFLMCCDCDAIFTERDDFSNHICTEKTPANTACQLCGLRGTHFSTCPRAVPSSNTITTSASCSFPQTDTGGNIADSKHSPQMTPNECGSASVTKYLIPVSSVKVPYKKTMLKKSCALEDSQEHSNELSDVDDDYDISNAASYCHVNIHEPIEKLTPVSEKTCTKIKTADTSPSTATLSTQVLSLPKSSISSHKSPTDTVLSAVDSSLEENSSLEDGKLEPVDKEILIPDKQQTVDDCLLLNKLLEQKSESASHLANNTSSDEDTNDSKSLHCAEENELTKSIQQTSSEPSTCISPRTTERDTGNVSSLEEYSAHSSPSKSQETSMPTIIETDLICTSRSPTTISMVDSKTSAQAGSTDVKLQTETDMTNSESLESANVGSKSPTCADGIKVKSPASTDATDAQYPASSDVIDARSPASLDVADVKSPASSDVADVKSPASSDVADVKSPASSDVADVKSPASSGGIDVKSPASSDVADVKSPASSDGIDAKSPASSDVADIKSPASSDVADVKSPSKGDEIDVISPTRDEIDGKSPTKGDETDVKSPTREDEIDVKSPTREDEIDVKSHTREGDIDVKSHTRGGDLEGVKLPARGEEIDVKSPAKDDVIDYANKSPITAGEIDVKSPERIDVIDVKFPEQNVLDSKSPATRDLVGSKSPERTEWNDYQYSKSPFITELEDSSTSSLRIELNNSSDSTTSKELSKSPVEFADSKSPFSGDLNNSRTSPTIGLKSSRTSLLELDFSKSPIRTAVLNDSSRTSSRTSSVDDILKSPSSLECHNNTQNSTDTNGSSPLTISKSTASLQPTFTKTYSPNTRASPTSDDGCHASPDNGTKANADLGIKLQISSNGTHIIIPKTTLNVAMPPKKRRKRKSRSSPKNALLVTNVDPLVKAEEDIPVLTDFGNNEDKKDENIKTTVNVKAKRKKAAKGKRSNKKSSRASKADAESFSGSENNLLEDSPLKVEEMSEYVQLAGDEVPAIELHLEDNLEALTIQIVLQESVKTSCPTCVYCNHAKKIAVNGKQLALHLLAEHKFLPVYSKCENTSDTSYLSADEFSSKKLHSSEELPTQVPTIEETENSLAEKKVLMDQYVNKLKMSLPDLHELFLNTDTYDSSDRTFSHPYDRTYECFHCNFLTVLHKELYVHNRKMHQKTILLCIMCKSNFYSYSELLCHLCPGIYVPDSNIKFRCHICSVDSLPSTFRLMVHLRKRHFVCDVCLETTDDQQKLSTHVWKHKLHHLCYRCGIAYRNKPDITKHLFWKHGTESVLCKKCLQKKWPHVYHFCIPPNAFVCEECNASFTRAVALKVHKRLHTGDLLHGCNECEEHFISKKLLIKHQDKHREVKEPKIEEQSIAREEPVINIMNEEPIEHKASTENSVSNQEHLSNHLESLSAGGVDTPVEDIMPIADVAPTHQHKKAEKKIDVYDLPPLNLSSDSDDSDGEQDVKTQMTTANINESLDVSNPVSTKLENVVTHAEEDTQQPVMVVDGIWDNFQNYKANLERRESQSSENVVSTNLSTFPATATGINVLTTVMLDHDYCVTEVDNIGVPEEIADQVPSTSAILPYPIDQRVVPTAIDEKTDDKNNSFDHDYCFNKGATEVPIVKEEECKENSETMAPNVDSSCANADVSIKKQKSQKKKKRSASSSSSDSSSSSGSSSCSCGENCSCSSSSSSSGSSSDSSDSEKSTSESRKRQIARKERREKVRRKKEEEVSARETLLTPGTQYVDEVNQACVPSEPEEKEVPIRESDLDTDETETDEDFYDQHPQLLANKLMAEKRNQLLLLAAVAPVNNVTPQPEPVAPSTSEASPQRKKVKSKKRKKRQHDAEKSSENKLKLSLSTSYYNYQTSNTDFYKPVSESHSDNPVHNFSQSSRLPPAPSIPNSVEPASVSSAAESGSETDSKRLSKRRRMPKKFYGDSSDEDSSSHTKWSRKPQIAVTSTPIPCPPPSPPPVYKSLIPPPEPARVQPITLAISEPEKSEEEDGAETESEQGDVKKSSSESSSESEGEKEMEIHTDSDAEPPLVVETAPVQQQQPQQVVKKNENLYCYCQCPYDEVSEMIACDGKDCTIEWFHFECVGIMVPPKGKWFCPDCKKSVATKNTYFS